MGSRTHNCQALGAPDTSPPPKTTTHQTTTSLPTKLVGAFEPFGSLHFVFTRIIWVTVEPRLGANCIRDFETHLD
jgi:hypothetical protein